MHCGAMSMVDVVDRQTRSRMMSGIRGKDTQPELIVRRALHRRGFRYSLKATDLPGKPDIVLPGWGVAVFIHGCFWHLHGCRLSKIPASNPVFWKTKLFANQQRDLEAEISLMAMGWRVAMVWECAMRGRAVQAAFDSAMDRLATWIREEPDGFAFEVSPQGSPC